MRKSLKADIMCIISYLNTNQARCGMTSYKLLVMEDSEGSKTIQAHGILG